MRLTAMSDHSPRLVKITHQSRLNGSTVIVRGRGGGMRLAGWPENINLGAVMRTAASVTLVGCTDVLPSGSQGSFVVQTPKSPPALRMRMRMRMDG
ncbi:Rrf2 family transcriptional regulator [Variovorax sp. PBL-E5]|uniref:Rrf2 family transcriptional regulator n=1 Tax=Variovorax sp. PBL-E5 TaxID=434014 RepID=UPI0013171DA6|nr:Rrf2 family transcriptional regulator [Variovorax sp. PBL-E5]VTU21902.1 hypothetical protein E5CHR_01282 [Variovorax sp. PBL-E5]